MLRSQSIFLVGPMGAGKTTIGNYLAKELDMQFIDTDQTIESRTGVNITWIFDVEGEEGFIQREIDIIDELTQLPGIVLATGAGATLAPENRKNLSARGIVLYLKASVDQRLIRVEHDQKRPQIQQGDKRETLEKLWIEREPYYREIADYTFVTENRNARTVASEITAHLRTQSAILKSD